MVEIKPFANIAEKCANYAKAMGKKSIIETLPVIKNVVTNPLVMDAKAILAKIHVETPLDEIKYEDFKKAINDKISGIVEEEFNNIKQAIKPFNQNNETRVRNELTNLCETCYDESEFSKNDIHEVMQEYNSDDFFDVFKDGSVSQSLEKWADRGEVKLIEYAKSKNISMDAPTEEIECAYKKIIYKRNAKCLRLFNLFTPKSTKLEVLELEEKIRKLGVKQVNFSDDVTQAKLVLEAVDDLIKAKIPLPKSIIVTPLLPTGNGGLCLNINRTRHICICTSLEDHIYEVLHHNPEKFLHPLSSYREAPQKFQNRYKDEIINYNRSKNNKQTFFHEIGHTFQQVGSIGSNYEMSEDEIKIANEISEYAASRKSGKEIVPEMFAMLMIGQTLTDKQMAFYLKLGGIVPQL